jgi:leucyl aminopeptidase
MPLKITVSSSDALAESVDLLGIPAAQRDLGDDPRIAALDQRLGGALRALAEQARFDGSLGQMLELPTLGRLPARRLVLLGTGMDSTAGSEPAVRRYVASLVRLANDRAAASVAAALPDGIASDAVRSAAEGVVLGAYRFTKYLTGERRPQADVRAVTLHVDHRPGARERTLVALGARIGDAVNLARDAVNEPPNTMTPAALAETAKKIAREHKLKLKVLDRRGMVAAGLRLHAAVGQGSANEPRFIHLSYTPKTRRRARMVFVGKGLTFDSGGLCLKPPAGMWEMKSDMAGAAAVLGLMLAVSALSPKVEVHGIIGAAENMPDGAAYRPGDVLPSLDGKTVEVINTDAEGRLVLADALAYARVLQPDLLVDAATLTGACVVALGKTYSAYYTASDSLARQIDLAARHGGDGFWRMPLIEELRDQLKSDVADLKHLGDRWAGSITAALFLREFVGDAPWIHCDIAGPVLADQARGLSPKGATGHPVLTFVRLVETFRKPSDEDAST